MKTFLLCLLLLMGSFSAFSAVTVAPPAGGGVSASTVTNSLAIAKTGGVGTNNGLLTPSFYGKVGIGIPSSSSLFAVELADGSGDQQIAIMRPNGTGYNSFTIGTIGLGDFWQIGMQNGTTSLDIRNGLNGAGLYISKAGNIKSSAVGSTFVDNVYDVMNLTGGYATTAYYAPNDGGNTPATSAALATGFGPGILNSNANSYAGSAYIATSPKNAIGIPPRIIISQEEDYAGGGYRNHTRTEYTTNGHINFYNYNSANSTGTLALHINASGNLGFGTSTNLTTNNGTMFNMLGTTYPTNAQTAANILAQFTNGGFWVGVISNRLQTAWWSNNVAGWKVLAP